MKENKFEEISDILKVLSHPVRLQIVYGLTGKKECNVTKMVKHLNLPQPNVSQHITILKNAGVIEGSRKGNEICYNLKSMMAEKIIEFLEIKDDNGRQK